MSSPISTPGSLGKRSAFTRFAGATARRAGHPATFGIALGVIAIWALTGPVFGFNDTWQLVINTGTTIITFLMVFLIQNTQNRDSHAIHVKLDELIRAHHGANNALIDIEELDEEELDLLRREFEMLAEKARGELHGRRSYANPKPQTHDANNG
jgi:low affinity Fe/Cu permease